MQVVITGASGDAQAGALEKAAHAVYRYGKAVLRVTPETLLGGGLPPALRETLPQIDAVVPQAYVCVETTCFPAVGDPRKLGALLTASATANP
jgi:hypothetical protein